MKPFTPSPHRAYRASRRAFFREVAVVARTAAVSAASSAIRLAPAAARRASFGLVISIPEESGLVVAVVQRRHAPVESGLRTVRATRITR